MYLAKNKYEKIVQDKLSNFLQQKLMRIVAIY